MLTFTYKDDCPYFKMDVINRVKNYLSLLIRNTKSNIKYYSNIELGCDYLNPHIHCQIYYTNYKQVLAIRDKIIERYGLFIDYCHVTLPKYDNVRYDYVIKDYLIKNDNELLLLDDMKRHYRSRLYKNIRFSAFSKEKYTKKIYKCAYGKGILKANVDYLLDNCIINNEIEIIDNRVIEFIKMLVLIQYRTSKISEQIIYEYLEVNNQYHQNIKIWRVFNYF